MLQAMVPLSPDFTDIETYFDRCSVIAFSWASDNASGRVSEAFLLKIKCWSDDKSIEDGRGNILTMSEAACIGMF